MAGGTPVYTPGEYYMYRVYDAPKNSVDSSRRQNCRLWKEIMPSTVSMDEIEQVVYKMSYKDFLDFAQKKKYEGENRFAAWIHRADRPVMDFLLLAKTTEYLRNGMNSKWYYPTMKMDAHMSLEDVVKVALSSEDKRLRPRYLLQAVRAMFTLKRYQECIDLWDKECSHLEDTSLMKRMIEPYIEGARYHVSMQNRSVGYFATMGDVESMLYCLGRQGTALSPSQTLELLYRYNPACPISTAYLQKKVRYMVEYYRDEERFEPELRKLYVIMQKIAAGKKAADTGMWYYSAAFLASEAFHDLQEASRLLTLAEQSPSSPFIEASIKVFRLYLDAKILPCDSNYEQKLFKGLEWLDGQIVENLTDEVRQKTMDENLLDWGISYYYWNDMMRRIAIGEAVPKLIRSGRIVRALQLANMGSNRLYQMVDKRTLYNDNFNDATNYFDSIDTLSLYDYRRKVYHNREYFNDFFRMIDTLGLENALAYRDRVCHPKDAFDSFLNARSYTDMDYINDIVGTQCMRHMDYRNAEKYLGMVTPAFDGHLNVDEEFRFDPFSLYERRIISEYGFRYNFAHRMVALEDLIKASDDSDFKARMIIKMAVGIRSSFGRCWPLTQYGFGYNSYFRYPMWDWESSPECLAAHERSIGMINAAWDMMKDREYAARSMYEFCNFRLLMERFPETQTAAYVRTHCDSYKDYHAEKHFLVTLRKKKK